MSDPRPTPLPEFRSPPISEVALAVQFDPLELAPAHLGLYALRMRDLGYDRIEQHPPLQPAFEHFGRTRPSPRVIIDLGNRVARHWFVAADGNRLVQLQPDRLIHNWRKRGADDEYPRYETIRATFLQRLEEFVAFTQDENLGELTPNQCEVTYVNHIRLDPSDSTGLSQVVGIAGDARTEGFLPAPEERRAAAVYVMTRAADPLGRLHVNARTGLDTDSQEPVVALHLTARGAPLSQGIEGVMGFLDLGREWIVRAFADVTTPTMHSCWERTR